MRTSKSGQRRRPTPIGNKAPDIDAEYRLMPKLNPAVVMALQQMMQEDQGMLRPPEQSARLLALCVELHRDHRPFPHREVAARVLGGAQSVYTVDTAVRNALADGYLSLVVETTRGHIAAREASIRKLRFLMPESRVLEVAQRADKKLAANSHSNNGD
jgi:hypothetical protein